jgi:hypothetical protein
MCVRVCWLRCLYDRWCTREEGWRMSFPSMFRSTPHASHLTPHASRALPAGVRENESIARLSARCSDSPRRHPTMTLATHFCSSTNRVATLARDTLCIYKEEERMYEPILVRRLRWRGTRCVSCSGFIYGPTLAMASRVKSNS